MAAVADDEGGQSDTFLMNAIRRQLGMAEVPNGTVDNVLSVAPRTITNPSADPVTAQSDPFSPAPNDTPPPSDTFRFLKPAGDFLGGVGDAIGGAVSGLQDAPVIGGALKGLSALGDATVRTPVGLAALGADQFLHTGLTQAAQRANAGRPIWELPKTATEAVTGAIGKVADNPNAAPWQRVVAGGARAINDVGSLVAPIPGVGELKSLIAARRAGTVADASKVAQPFGDAQQAARAMETPIPRGEPFRFDPNAARDARPATPAADNVVPFPIERTSSERFVVQPIEGKNGLTPAQIIDTKTGKPAPFAFENVTAAQRQAERLNAGPEVATVPDRQTAIAKASKDFLAASGLTENPKPDPRFGDPGTAFHGVDMGSMVREIQSTTPYRSFQEFAQAVRSGDAAQQGAPQHLIDRVLRGDAEKAGSKWVPPSTPADIAAGREAAANGTVPGETIAEAKQRLADRMGVDATTGMPLKGPLSAEGITVPSAPSRIQPDRMRQVENVMSAPKTLLTVSPLHAALRQALPFIAYPVEYGKSLGKSAGAFLEGVRDPQAAGEALAKRSDELRAANEAANPGGTTPYVASAHHGISGGEEQIASNLLDKTPVLGRLIAGSKGAFVTMGNEVRSAVFTNAAKSGVLSGAQLDDLANTLNHFSGRGFNVTQGSQGEAFARAANSIFFSPQLAVSRARMLKDALDGFASVGADLATGHAPDPVALTKIRLAGGYVAALGGMYGLAQAAGLKVDLNPVSSNFLRIDMGTPDQSKGVIASVGSGLGLSTVESQGHVWLDPSAGESTLLKTLARLFTGHEVTSGGKDIALNAGGRNQTTYADVIGSYLRGKLGPVPGDVMNLALGKDATGKPFGLRDLVSPGNLTGLFVPLMIHDYFAASGNGADTSASAAPADAGSKFQFKAPGQRSTSTSGAPTSAGKFQFSAPGGTTGKVSVGSGGHQPAPMVPGDGASIGDIPTTISSVARRSGIDPLLALATGTVESNLNPRAVGDNGQSHGVFQERLVYGRGGFTTPDPDPARQTARFAADVRALLASGFRGSPGQIAAAVQRPADPAGYARKVDAAYAALGGR